MIKIIERIFDIILLLCGAFWMMLAFGTEATSASEKAIITMLFVIMLKIEDIKK